MTELLDPRADRPARVDPPGPAAAPQAPVRRRVRLARFLGRRPGLVVSILVIVFVLVSAVVPQVFAPGDPNLAVPRQRSLPPGPGHWFGTDYLGRDMWTRVVHGTSLSLQATLIAVAVALVVGGLIGLLAGFVGRWVDEVLMRVVDVLLAIPPILLALEIGRASCRERV